MMALPLMLESANGGGWKIAMLPCPSSTPSTLLPVTVLEITERVERPTSNTPAPLLDWTVAFRRTAVEATKRPIPDAGVEGPVWPAVELPLIVLVEGRPKPGSPIYAVDPLRAMPGPAFPLIVLPPGRSALALNTRTPKRPTGLLGLVPLPVRVLPKMS